MSLLLIVGNYALWFVINSLAYLYIAFISGTGLAVGFHCGKKLINKNYARNLERELISSTTEEVIPQGATT